jgi:hypothetical protein
VELLVAIDALDDLLHEGKSAFLRPSQVRVHAEAYRAAVARLRAAIATDLPHVVAPAVAGPVAQLERIGETAPRKGESLRLDVEEAYDQLDRARAVVLDDTQRQRDR